MRKADGGDHQDGRQHIGQDVLSQNGGFAAANELGSQHIVFLFFHHHRATHGACVLYPVGQTNRHDDDEDSHVVAVALGQQATRNAEDQQRHQDDREGQLHIGNAHQQRVEPATGIAGDQAQRHTDDERQRHR